MVLPFSQNILLIQTAIQVYFATVSYVKKKYLIKSQVTWVLVIALPIDNYMNFSKSYNITSPCFSNLKN